MHGTSFVKHCVKITGYLDYQQFKCMPNTSNINMYIFIELIENAVHFCH